eukprot:gnl/TRDRNA2_/TRDRNA2_57891_c0_seq1.p1 gnl/TRDRNA2_/TRDRNA2_57891_c0~~gnl/TRDRNA2_/TRDRNA2_57891_c0_seq1.p1  ORF type:complete len:284 (+),score=58.16 gnl/TRDRNA2_/TRDRNA2_57891_c0_seq1:129-980(+)
MLSMCSKICKGTAESAADAPGQPERRGAVPPVNLPTPSQNSKELRMESPRGPPKRESDKFKRSGSQSLDLKQQPAAEKVPQPQPVPTPYAHKAQSLGDSVFNTAPADFARPGVGAAMPSNVPGPFGVMRQRTANTKILDQLRKQLAEINEQISKERHADELRRRFIADLERETFEKAQSIQELRSRLGQQVAGASEEKEKLNVALREREAETADLRRKLEATQVTVKEKQAEVSAKGEVALQLVSQMSKSAEQQRLEDSAGAAGDASRMPSGGPLAQASPAVV